MSQRLARGFLVAISSICVSAANAAFVESVVWNNASNGVGDDLPGLTNSVTASSALGGVDDPKEVFGQNSGPIEPGTFLFTDGQVPDNGNATLGDGGETVNTLNWTTSSPLIISGYRAYLGAENPTQNRGTQLLQFSSAGEIDDAFDDNAQTGFTQLFVDRFFTIDQVASSFQIDLTAHNASGPRLIEVDAILPDPVPPAGTYLDTVIFNATTNSGGDEAPGLGTNFAASSAVNGVDTIEDAFGNNDGAVEPTSFIFGDLGAVADNGNNIFEGGLETIDWLSWETTLPITLAGYQISLASDGANPNRGTELLAFYVDNVLMDILDMNGASGTFQRAFQSGPIRGDSFRIELTRSVDTGGSRIFEVDAIVVPEANALAILSLAAIACAYRLNRNRFNRNAST